MKIPESHAKNSQADKSIAGRLRKIREDIVRVCRKVGRDPREITIVGVSKKQPVEKIRLAYHAGVRIFGESYWQEARDKFLKLSLGAWVERGGEKVFAPAPNLLGVEWHFIGRLQKNKVKHVVRFFRMIQSVDDLELLEEIEKRVDGPYPVLVEVNLAGEASKGGIPLGETEEFIERARFIQKVKIMGLMAMGSEKATRKEKLYLFGELAALFRHLGNRPAPHAPMRTLSLGMSGDYREAVASGATMVRLGTVLFGRREADLPGERRRQP